MKYSYEISWRSIELGGGWRLRMLEDGEEVGGDIFSVALDDPQAGVAWWNGCTEPERAHWLAMAKSAVPAEAWAACQFAEAHADAENAAYEWLDSRENV
jgi:hypothetical protein